MFDGTNWHDGLDILKMKPEAVCRRCAPLSKADPACPICQGTTFLVGTPIEAVARCFDRAYSVYGELTEAQAEKVETRRTVLLYSLVAYQWYYSEDTLVKKTLARELPFETELTNGTTGKPFPDVVVMGKIDNMFRRADKSVCIMEHKSTTSELEPDSMYWNKLRFDPQTTMYPWALRDMQAKGELRDFGIKETDAPVATVIYDVWRKPQIKPKNVPAADTKELLTTGMYCGEHFEVEAGSKADVVCVNGVTTSFIPNAKGTGGQIRETQAMFGARLLQAIVAEPERYFARHEISRTTWDLEEFERDLVNVARTMRHMISRDSFYHDYTSCDDFGGCDARAICYNELPVGADDVPTGYKCIFSKKGIEDGATSKSNPPPSIKRTKAQP
jgi:hypothetical protein